MTHRPLPGANVPLYCTALGKVLLASVPEAELRKLLGGLNLINLVILDPELEASIPSRKLDYPGQRQRVTRRLRAMPQTARVRVAREQVKRIGVLTREAEQLKRELRDLVAAHHPELLAETGCGPLTAAILIGQTAGAERFHSDAHFARMAGVAPILVSSGRKGRHRLDRGGNRQINRALHVIAITRGPAIPRPANTCNARNPKARAGSRPSDASSATSHATTTDCSYGHQCRRTTRALRTNVPNGVPYLT